MTRPERGSGGLDGPASRWARRAVDAVVALAMGLLAWEPNFAHGFVNYNESGQHLAAIAALERGQHLYRDVFVQYGPLHYHVPAWLFAHAGAGLHTLRGYFLAGEIASLLAAFALARTLVRPRAFAWAAGVAVAIYAHFPFWSTRWGGVRFAFVYLTVLALARAVGARRPAPWWAAAGIASALAFLHTYEAAAVAGATAVAYALHEAWRAPGTLLPFAGWYGGALLAVLLPFAAAAWRLGTLAAFVDQLPLADPGRAWVQPTGAADLEAVVLLPAFVYGVALAALAIRAARGRWRPDRDGPLALAVVAGGLLYLLAFRAIRGPQLETSLPLAVVVASAGLARVAAAGRPRSGLEWLRAGAAGLATVAFLVGAELRPYAGGLASWARYQLHKAQLVPRHEGAERLDEGFRRTAVAALGTSRLPRAQAEEVEGAVAAIRRLTGPDEPFFAYPDLGIFYALADRPAPTRFHIAILAAARAEWTHELQTLLERDPPALALRSRGRSTLARATRHPGEYLPGIAERLARDYDVAASSGGLEVLRRRAASKPARR